MPPPIPLRALWPEEKPGISKKWISNGLSLDLCGEVLLCLDSPRARSSLFRGDEHWLGMGGGEQRPGR